MDVDSEDEEKDDDSDDNSDNDDDDDNAQGMEKGYWINHIYMYIQ